MYRAGYNCKQRNYPEKFYNHDQINMMKKLTNSIKNKVIKMNTDYKLQELCCRNVQ